MRLGNHSRLSNLWHRNNVIFEINGGDPLSAGFDHVLGAVTDDDVLIGINFCDISGDQPAIVKLFGLRIVVVLGCNPGATDAKFAHRFAIMRQGIPVLIENFNFQSRHGETSLGNILELLIFG